jgi:hypothetical protein
MQHVKLTKLDFAGLSNLKLSEWIADRDFPELRVESTIAKEYQSMKMSMRKFIEEKNFERPDWIPLDNLISYELCDLSWCEAIHQLAESGLISGSDLMAGYHEVFGNPFKPVKLPRVVKEHYKDTVYPLALEMYRRNDFRLMKKLGDELAKLGCNEKRILDHCYSDQKHFRGCWVVDLILGCDC